MAYASGTSLAVNLQWDFCVLLEHSEPVRRLSVALFVDGTEEAKCGCSDAFLKQGLAVVPQDYSWRSYLKLVRS